VLFRSYDFVVFNCLLLINTAMNQRFITCLLAIFVGSDSFAPQAAGRQKTQRYFGLPSFGSKEDKNKADTVPKEKIGLKGLVQLITAGAGSPFLGDYEGTDPETGKMYFSLEANNLVDENGESKQTKMPYFESGWVSDEDLEKERNRQPFKFPWDK